MPILSMNVTQKDTFVIFNEKRVEDEVFRSSVIQEQFVRGSLIQAILNESCKGAQSPLVTLMPSSESQV